jgi:phytol kinase
MNKDIINTLLLALAFLLLFALGEVLYHKFYVRVEFTRKLVHFGTGILTLLFPLMLNDHWLVFFLCASFLLLLMASARFKLLPSINAIDRHSYGSFSYPVSVYGCYLVYNHYNNNLIFFYLPILVLAICDPVAALIGKKIPLGKFKVAGDTKTMIGTSSFFITSFLLSLEVLRYSNFAYLQPVTVISAAVIVAATSALVEAISGKGLDNITIPASVIAVLILFT